MVRLSWLRRLCQALAFFFFSDTASTEIYTLSYTTLFRSWRGGRTAAASVAPAEPSGDWLCLDADPRSDYRAQPQAADRRGHPRIRGAVGIFAIRACGLERAGRVPAARFLQDQFPGVAHRPAESARHLLQ